MALRALPNPSDNTIADLRRQPGYDHPIVQPGRNLHIHARYFYVRDLVARQELMVVKIHTNDQLADILVSFKSFETFLRLRTLLLNCAYVVVVPQREANVADKLEWVATYLM